MDGNLKVQWLLGWIWHLGPVGAFLLSWFAMPGIVLLISWLEGALRWRNPALVIGDVLLCAVIGMGSYSSYRLHASAHQWLGGSRFMWAMLLSGYALCALLEKFGRFREGLSWSSYTPADIWHAAMFGPMFYWVVASLCAIWLAAITDGRVHVGMAITAAICVVAWMVTLPFTHASPRPERVLHLPNG